MTTLHEAAQKALELNLEELKQIATLWKNFRIGNMGDYSKRAVELLKLQSQYHAAAAPDIVLELIRQIESLRSALAQQGEQQPLTTQQRDDLWNALPVQDTNQDYYIMGILDAERHHGIAGAAPAAQPHVTPNQAARFRAQHLFLEWNRAQKDLPVAIAMEYHVFQNAIDLYFEAVKLNGIGVRK